MAPDNETIAGRYELQRVIGRGGMGVVYRGHDRLLDRVVAVKVLPAAFASDPILVQRFEREARAVARLNHPNIVSIFDTGRDGTVRYIVMEFISGESLAQRLSEREGLAVSEAVAIAAQIADALAAAHTAGIVHRDIKPANVMVQPTGACKVLDFGIARAAAEAAMTQSASMLGSVMYMAPETALGQVADARSDIYSLGCVLYEMLTGELPFWGEVPAAVISQHVSAPPRPPRELEPSIPPALDDLVLRMLAKDPAERPQDANTTAAALRASPAPASPAPASPAPASPATASPGAARTMVAPPAELPTRLGPPPPPQRSRSPAGLIGVAALVALLVGIGIALAASSGSDRNSSTTTTSHTASSLTSSPSSSSSTPTSSSTRSSSTTKPSTSTSTTTITSTPSTQTTSSSTTSSAGASSSSGATPTTGP